MKHTVVYYGAIVCALTYQMLGVKCTNLFINITDKILANYDSGLRPKCDGVDLVNATMGIAVRQVIALDEPNQIAKFNLWIRLKWNDCTLQWTPSDYQDTPHIIMPIKKIWLPDLILFDSVSTEFYGMNDYRATVYSDGTVYYNFPTIIEALCPIDVTDFPFDSQVCNLVFGSWAYSGLELDLHERDNPGDLSFLKQNVEWKIPKILVERHVVKYGCCPEPYPDVTFYVYLERKPGYYITNIIIPSMLITILAILGYFLPVDSGEKVSLVITVMLAMSVFQLLVADKLPPSADSTPWIMIFFNFILSLSAISTIIQVIVINVYYRGDAEVSLWTKRYIILPLCRITLVNIVVDRTPVCCGKEKKVESYERKPEEINNMMLWQSFAVALDRIGMVLFTITLIVGSSIIFKKIGSTS